jgi:hypothetical protein
MYAPRVIYRFKVGDNVFLGDDIGMISASSNPKAPQKFVARYPLRSRVAVFYDPKNPTDSTAKPGVFWLPLLLCVSRCSSRGRGGGGGRWAAAAIFRCKRLVDTAGVSSSFAADSRRISRPSPKE